MKHPSIRDVFDYWNEQRGLRSAPERSEIEPSAIRSVLADTFILAYDAPAGHPFRLAGTRVCAIFGRELKDQSFVGLWSAASRPQVRDLLGVVAAEAIAVVASAAAKTVTGDALDLEMLVLPLGHRGRTNVRVLGALASMETPYWLGISALGPLSLGSLRYVDVMRPASLMHNLASPTPSGRLRHGLVVYDGGQS
jgi:hypothetical protein